MVYGMVRLAHGMAGGKVNPWLVVHGMVDDG